MICWDGGVDQARAPARSPEVALVSLSVTAGVSA
jgi:hypothetical protein